MAMAYVYFLRVARPLSVVSSQSLTVLYLTLRSYERPARARAYFFCAAPEVPRDVWAGANLQDGF